MSDTGYTSYTSKAARKRDGVKAQSRPALPKKELPVNKQKRAEKSSLEAILLDNLKARAASNPNDAKTIQMAAFILGDAIERAHDVTKKSEPIDTNRLLGDLEKFKQATLECGFNESNAPD